MPSKLGPCRKFDLGRGTKFCMTCGHTNGKHTGEVTQARLDAEARVEARKKEYKTDG